MSDIYQIKQTLDPYLFCLGDPAGYIDPNGEWAIPLVSIAWGAGAAIGYYGYKGYQAYKEKASTKPPFNWEDLGDDPTICPGKGFEWKGNGTPESGKGNWVRGKKPDREPLNPDFDHGAPISPHWDYIGPDFPKGVRIKPDGTWEHKFK